MITLLCEGLFFVMFSVFMFYLADVKYDIKK